MRRHQGTGSVFYLSSEGGWFAKISLLDGRTVRRKRHSEEEARAALADLLREYAGQLGFFYQMPRPCYFADRPKRARGPITAGLRFRILERDGFACHYCGARPPDATLHVDHVVPIAHGGTDNEANLVAACSDCNLGKADQDITVLGAAR